MRCVAGYEIGFDQMMNAIYCKVVRFVAMMSNYCEMLKLLGIHKLGPREVPYVDYVGFQ